MEKADFITIERHPTREAVIEAERIAIQTEKPQANIQYQPDEEKRIAWRKTLKQSNRPKPPPVVPLELAVLREAALEETRAATKDLIQAVREEAARGITEVELARRARVARGTIRKWLGK